jgi:hypothetical protein
MLEVVSLIWFSFAFWEGFDPRLLRFSRAFSDFALVVVMLVLVATVAIDPLRLAAQWKNEELVVKRTLCFIVFSYTSSGFEVGCWLSQLDMVHRKQGMKLLSEN